jgi:hypothetical protein
MTRRHDPEMVPEPPEWLRGAPARAAFVNAYRACVQRNDWEPIYSSMLGMMAGAAGRHVQLQREIAQLDPTTVSPEIRSVAIETRRVARQAMVAMLLIPESAIEGAIIPCIRLAPLRSSPPSPGSEKCCATSIRQKPDGWRTFLRTGGLAARGKARSAWPAGGGI